MSALRFWFGLLLLALLAACAQTPQIMRYDIAAGAGPDSAKVWPPPPEVPRYRFAGQLTGEDNFIPVEQREPGAGERFLRWLVGLGQRPSKPRILIRPQSGMADPAAGRVYVTDQGRQAVFVFDESEGRLQIWDQADGNSRFRSPVGITAADNGEILVADSMLARIVRLDKEGNPRGSFGQSLLQRPTGLARDPLSNHLFVADTAAHDIKVLNSSGGLVTRIGRRGTGPGEFNAPTHLAFAAGKLYVSDTLNTRIQVLSADGEPLAQIGKRGLYIGNLTRPKGVAVDADGNVYVVESYYDHLLIFSQQGEFLLPLGGSGNAIGQFYLPAGAWSDNRDRIYVADMFNRRVIILQYLGS